MVSEILYEYEGRFSRDDNRRIYCEWPVSKENFKRWKSWYKSLRDFKTYEDYLASNPRVEYFEYWDQGFYNLKNTDGTIYAAFQDDSYITVIHIDDISWRNKAGLQNEGFACVVAKDGSEIHCISLGEDDGNYWGDHEIENLTPYEWHFVTAVINDMTFEAKNKIIEEIWKRAKL